MKRLCSLAVLLSAISAAQAAELSAPKAAPPMDAKSAADIASYGIGLQIANKFKADGVEINVDQLILGLKDAMQGVKPRYAEEPTASRFPDVRPRRAGETAISAIRRPETRTNARARPSWRPTARSPA